MSVTITYQLSGAGQRESLRQRGSGKQIQTVTIGPDDPAYAKAVDLASIDSDGKASIFIGDRRDSDGAYVYGVDVPTPKYDAPQTAADLIDGEIARRADTSRRIIEAKAKEQADKAEREAKAKASAEKWASLPLAVRASESGVCRCGKSGDYDGPLSTSGVVLYDEYDLRKFAPQAWGEAVAEHERLAAEREAAESARKEAGIAVLRKWATDHGSDLLRARIEDGYEWLGLAEREWANAIVAGVADLIEGRKNDDIDAHDRTTPTLEEIRHLRSIRKQLGDKAKAELKWVEFTEYYDDDDDDDDDREHVKRAEVEVTATCPTGREIVFYFACPEKVAA